jgi:hypothetical protein
MSRIFFVFLCSIYLSNIYNRLIKMDYRYKNMMHEILEERALVKHLGKFSICFTICNLVNNVIHSLLCFLYSFASDLGCSCPSTFVYFSSLNTYFCKETKMLSQNLFLRGLSLTFWRYFWHTSIFYTYSFSNMYMTWSIDLFQSIKI